MSYNFTSYRYYAVQKISKLYSSQKTETVPIEQQLITSPCPKYLATTILVFISVSLTILDISYMWKHAYLSFCGWLISLSRTSSRFIVFVYLYLFSKVWKEKKDLSPSALTVCQPMTLLMIFISPYLCRSPPDTLLGLMLTYSSLIIWKGQINTLGDVPRWKMFKQTNKPRFGLL